jgi:integrase
MTTLVLPISNVAILEHKNSVTVTRLRDPKTSLLLIYSSVNREKGVFYIRIYQNKKDKFIKIGKFPGISAKVAQQAVKNIRRREDHFDYSEIQSMTKLCDWFIERTEANKQIALATRVQNISIINNHIRPYLSQYNISEINLNTLNKTWFMPLQSTLALSSISLVIIILKAIFSWAKRLEMITINPIEELSLSNFTHQKVKPKIGRLTEVRLKQSISSLAKLSARNQTLVMLLLFHGTRIGETTTARWDDFDFENLLWRIPASQTKTKQAHTLALTPFVAKWLITYKAYQYTRFRSQYLFPQQSNKRKVQSNAISSRMVNAFSKGEFTAHDIRKYARTTWLEQGIDYIVGEMLLNHSLSKLDQSYIQTTAQNLCRKALEQWTEYIIQLGIPMFAYTGKSNRKK